MELLLQHVGLLTLVSRERLKLPWNLPVFLWASLPSSVIDKEIASSSEPLEMRFATLHICVRISSSWDLLYSKLGEGNNSLGSSLLPTLAFLVTAIGYNPHSEACFEATKRVRSIEERFSLWFLHEEREFQSLLVGWKISVLRFRVKMEWKGNT